MGSHPVATFGPLDPDIFSAESRGVIEFIADYYRTGIQSEVKYMPGVSHYLDGVELAESICMSPHKWLLTNLDCCCLWVRNSAALVDCLSTDPEILRNKASEAKVVVDYKDWQVATTRRFRALKLWVVFCRYGVDNMMKHIRSDVAMAEHFEGLVKLDRRFEVVVPRKFSLVCFRLGPRLEDDDGYDLNDKLLEAVNSSGRAFMSHAVVGGVHLLRFAVGTALTEMGHLDAAWKLIQDKASGILAGGLCRKVPSSYG
ncbi:putative tyrosine decarboxylase 1-like [Cocos nucifera]|uniref:Putative tyrosine decarboxylase 1-like n=1 Tax=Cocos nucifera TaxID=13894 RepID=A0A8K0IGD5_COCNU|nr:putative tyrosine decarboxylase 1-like [Cocos nucifera]